MAEETPRERLERIGFLCSRSAAEVKQAKKEELFDRFNKAGGYRDMPPPKIREIYPLEIFEYCKTKGFTHEECCTIVADIAKTMAYFHRKR